MKERVIVTAGLVMALGIGPAAFSIEAEADRVVGVELLPTDQAVGQTEGTNGLTTTAIFPQSEAEPHVKWINPDFLVTNLGGNAVKPSIAAAPNGDLFVAVEELDTTYVRIYQSTDGGQSWSWTVGFSTGTDSRNPALTYVENSGDSWLVLVYEVVRSATERGVSMVRFDPYDVSNWVPILIDDFIVWTVPGNELHPQITSDFPDFSSSVYLYVTYAVPSIDYYPVFFSRSTDRGLTWSTPTNITGGSENSAFETRPAIGYCANNNDLYVAFSKPGWTGSTFAQQVWVTSSDDFGVAWGAPVQVTNSARPDYHPSVAAAWDSDIVMVAFTSEFSADDTDVKFSYSADGGTIWGARISMPGWTFDREDHVDLVASQIASGRFHAVYRHDLPTAGGDIWYQWSEVLNPGVWSPVLDVDEGSAASGHGFYPNPAIWVNPKWQPSQEASIVWTSDQGPSYEVYFDGPVAGTSIFADGFESGDVLQWSSSLP